MGNLTNAKVLVVEDSTELYEFIEEALLPIGVKTVFAATLKDAKEILKKSEFDLFLLDIYLPDGDGFDFFSYTRALEAFRDTPVIFLSSSDDIRSKLSAFTLGAEDYILKPCHPLELRARVEARLKKMRESSKEKTSFSAGPLLFDVPKQVVRVQETEESIDLTPREFRILLFLAKRKEVVLSREVILNGVWGSNIRVVDRVVDAHIYTLRRKLGKLSRIIRSIPGEGYTFDPALQAH